MSRILGRGIVTGVFTGVGGPMPALPFITAQTPRLDLDMTGIPGDLHGGSTRRAGVREPWLPRGVVMRNDRQLSALCRDELAEIAAELGIATLAPQAIGGNLLIDGLDGFSRIAPGSHLAFGGAWGGKGRFDGGAVLRVEAYNKPCRRAGRGLATVLGQPDLEFAFVKAAGVLRGLMLSVEVAGAISTGDPVVLLAPIVAGERR